MIVGKVIYSYFFLEKAIFATKLQKLIFIFAAEY